MLFEIIIALLSFILAKVLTGLCVKYFPKFKIVDNPNIRKKHKAITPTSGGVVIAFLISLFALIYFGYSSNVKILYFLFAIIILTIISFLDDIIHLKVLVRLPFHFLVAWLVIKSLSPIIIPQLEFIPQNIMDILLIIGMVYFINIYNFMDGIDGSAASEAIHISLSFILISIFFTINEEFSLLNAIILCGSCLGFLIHNWSPAKIFLGDVGSTVIGLVCGWLMLILGKYGFLAAALIIPGYYIADSTITLLSRMIKREKFWEPHTQHFFQVAVKNINCHATVTKKIIKYNIILLILSLTSLFLPRTSLVLAILIISRLLFKFKKKKQSV